MIPIAEKMDSVGFWSMEVWRGATFDTMHRFLAEGPFDRIRTLKKYIIKIPFSMLFRGQNLVGYRNYADDVAKLFVDKACEAGMEIFRVFDALNDIRNDVFNLDYYVSKAKEIQDMGANSLCIKDMAGIMSAFDVGKLIRELKKVIRIPIHLYTHHTSGIASMVYLEAIKAGVDI